MMEDWLGESFPTDEGHGARASDCKVPPLVLDRSSNRCGHVSKSSQSSRQRRVSVAEVLQVRSERLSR